MNCSAVHTLQVAYAFAVHLEELAADRDAVLTTRALATASFGVCQAVVTIGPQLDPDADHEVVVDIARRLVNAHHALANQRSASANLACRELERAVNMLGNMSEVCWPTAEQEETYVA